MKTIQYIWKPNVKRWFNKEGNKNSEFTCIDTTDQWYLYNRPGIVTFTIDDISIENTKYPTLKINLKTTFDSAYKDKEANWGFRPPYQESATVTISSTDTQRVNAGLLSSNFNINNTTEITEHGPKTTLGLVGGVEHEGVFTPEVKMTLPSSHMKYHRYDMIPICNPYYKENTQTNDETGYDFIANMTQSYYKTKPYQYDIENPDKSMHWYGHTPDYLNAPAPQAKAGLTFLNEVQFLLKKNVKNTILNIGLEQALVGMQMWGIHNHCFKNTFKTRLSLNIDTSSSTPSVSSVGFFGKNNTAKCKIKTIYSMNSNNKKEKNVIKDISDNYPGFKINI
jgi:hypothetical protein